MFRTHHLILPSVSGSTAALTIDTVTSASPYIFNISLRSVFGMNGLLADGSKASGFASMMVAQFTGIGLQKDNNAFLKYNSTTGAYDDGTVSGNESLNTDSRAVYKPSYSGSHIKAINGATIQILHLYLRLVMQSTSYQELVVRCQLPTPTQTLEQRH